MLTDQPNWAVINRVRAWVDCRYAESYVVHVFDHPEQRVVSGYNLGLSAEHESISIYVYPDGKTLARDEAGWLEPGWSTRL